MQLTLVKIPCLQGCGTHLAVDTDAGWSIGVGGCGGPYGRSTSFDPRKLSPRQRKQVEEAVARESSRGFRPRRGRRKIPQDRLSMMDEIRVVYDCAGCGEEHDAYRPTMPTEIFFKEVTH
jgi:hypothetical protein